ncbi:MAG: LysR family transcriptional regulator [Ruminococcaceae bacterium]|nr:LysR family transcriptional regulator [Oscillospiraceae bacterium]
MKIEQIQQVIAVYRAGSINKAAQELYLAQSTLSSSIHAVEQELQQTIFVRSPGGIALTDFGHSFVRHGADILNAHQKILTAAQASGMFFPGEKLNVSVSHILFINRIFHQLYGKYRDKNAEFCYRNDSQCRIIEDVSQGISELGVLAMPSILKTEWLALITSHGLEYSVLSHEQAHVLFGPSSPLCDHPQDSISVGDLQPLTRVSSRKEHPLFQQIDNEISRIFHCRECIYADSQKQIPEILRETNAYYIATMNKSAYQKKPYDSVIRHLLIQDAPFSFEFGFIHPSGQSLSPAAAEFIELICQAVR